MTIGNEEVRDCPGSKGIQGVGEEGGSAYVAGDVVKMVMLMTTHCGEKQT